MAIPSTAVAEHPFAPRANRAAAGVEGRGGYRSRASSPSLRAESSLVRASNACTCA
jgi:hypothetical protein